MIYWFFGLPGIGKDYCAERLSQLLQCPHLDADNYLNEIERTKLLAGSFNSDDRLAKLKRICDDICVKLNENNCLTVADSLPNEAARRFILDTFSGDVALIFVSAPSHIHQQRLSARQDHFFTPDLLKDYVKNNWQPVQCQHIELVNDLDAESLDKQLKNIAINTAGHQNEG